MQVKDMNTKQLLQAIYNAISDKKGEQIKIIDISDISSIADYFVIASGNNSNQVQAISDNVLDELIKINLKPSRVEGYNTANWILMDYNDIIIHIFSKDDRFFYNLERIWSDGKYIENIEEI